MEISPSTRQRFIRGALGASLIFAALLTSGSTAEATPRTCSDANGGAIDQSDGLDIAGIQAAVGVETTGVFTDATCQAVWDKLIALGKVTGRGTSSHLKIGSRTQGWLGVSGSQQTESQDSGDCPQTVTSAAAITSACRTAAEALLRKMGFTDSSLERAIKAFQTEAGVTTRDGSGYGTLGPKTYSSIMSGKGLETIQSAREIDDGIVVDLSDQTLKVFSSGVLIASALVSTGKAGEETDAGTFEIYRSRTSDTGWVYSSLQDPAVDPVMFRPHFFDGNKAIHGTRTVYKLGERASRGCVRVDPDFMLTLLDTGSLARGTVVSVQK